MSMSSCWEAVQPATDALSADGRHEPVLKRSYRRDGRSAAALKEGARTCKANSDVAPASPTCSS
ncbi:hypothetical protein K458DRAFT_419405 [Lentithecium fluviatile CBS 122367]|uniref:Uncharacterized protein n=1 Tax=Lentithecium fluviatile CBS 122367 TaxID=1168545 RepID=A0A6G1IY84_9PLEO|nr:hypothetical protein K458DRAFT_419405 [Lentithecium fluviatile CBS 122367]